MLIFHSDKKKEKKCFHYHFLPGNDDSTSQSPNLGISDIRISPFVEALLQYFLMIKIKPFFAECKI